MTAAKSSTGTASAKGKPTKAATSKGAPAPSVAKAVPAQAAPAKAPRVAGVPASTLPAKSAATKSMPAKAAPAKSTGAGRKGRADSGSEANLHKRVDSERIALHIAAFEKSGGRVEKLGITRVLQKVDEVAASAPAMAKPAGRKR